MPLLSIFRRAHFLTHRSGRGTSSCRTTKQLILMIPVFFASPYRARVSIFLIVLMISLASCQKSKTSAVVSKRAKIDVCGLITNQEVQSIQESPIKDTKPSEQSDGSFRIGQCFYTAETFNKSVSLAVTQADPASDKARNPKDV